MVFRKNGKHLILLIFGAACLGFSAIFVKSIGLRMGLTAIAFWRMFLGGIILFSVLAAMKKPLLLPKRALPWAMLAGLFFAMDMSVWHRCIIITGAGISTILGNTQVFNTAILSYFIFREKPTVRFIIAVFTAMAGVILLAGIGSRIDFTKIYVAGIFLGLLAGFFYSCYLIVLRKVTTTIGPDPMTFIGWICIFGSIFLGLGSTLESGSFFPPDIRAFSLLFGLALTVQVLGWWSIFSALSKIEASRVGLALLIQPTLATILGYFIFGERLLILQILGGVMTVAGIYYGVKHKKMTGGG